ncbi:MarR family winged helix-turn-helix transcriptional regulator [Microbacterium sp. ZW T5_56]|uniref:MarR family winged helix-turn-helix transcriptional regulator n=1 Tax=Microbacterium sp. ZW T5_56 TaxID=3378081 RepID=UPI00385288DE
MNNRRLAMEAWESLFRAQHRVFEEISRDFDGSLLSQQEYDVLLTVVRSADMTARLRDVTSRSLISQPSVSRLVDRMAARGLVTKRTDPDDGRGSLITATAEGERRFRILGTRHGTSIAERMSVLTPEEQQVLLALTTKLRTATGD